MPNELKSPFSSLGLGLERRATCLVLAGLGHGMAWAGRQHPSIRRAERDVALLRDVAYGPGGTEHRLDLYHPADRPGPWPALLYVHGGGFSILSKETHWPLALSFARQGLAVFNINYRRTPGHPFPAALQDVCLAYRWLVAHAADYGADPTRLLLAGESAGANLITALTVAACYERPEPWARAVFAAERVPWAVLPACGLLQVSNVERFFRQEPPPSFFARRRLEAVNHFYLGQPIATDQQALADPLCLLEKGDRPARPLPPFFAAVGGQDPVRDDTRRLAVALERLGGRCEMHIYPGEPHAFHALLWRRQARRHWKDTAAFLERVLATP